MTEAPFNYGMGPEQEQSQPPQLPYRAQLQYPLDLQSEGALKLALENVEKDVIRKRNRIQTTLLSGTTSFDVASDYMVMTAQAAVTIATIRGGREGQILTLQFGDANITITDTGTGATDTVNLSSSFVSSTNSVLKLLFDGTSWREVGRGTGLATAAETTTGTDATKAITPDALAGSDYGKRIVELVVVEGATNVAVGDKQGNLSFRVPTEMNGWNLVGVAAHVETAGTTNNLDIQIHNITQAADMLSTKMRIETAETDTSTSAQPGTIDAANDDVATGDKIRVDVDAVQTTPPKGLTVTLVFQLP